MPCSESEEKKDSKTIELTSLKSALTEAAEKLKGSDCRIFMAKIVNSLGRGGQRKAETVLGRNRKTIRKGQYEIENGIYRDNFSERGRRKAEEKLPNLLADIRDIVEPTAQADPTFGTVKMYAPVTAASVRECLSCEKGYASAECPTSNRFTISTNNTKSLL